jgi:hypothetical protein
VVALGGADAHGGPGQRAEEQTRSLLSTVGIPSYEASFRELSVRAILDEAPSGQAAADARAIFSAIRRGRVFTVIDALASPALLDLHAAPSGTTVSIIARATLTPGAQIVLIGPAGELVRSNGELRYEAPAAPAAAYRAEVRLAGAPGQPPVPWLVSNPVYVGEPEQPSGGPPEPAVASAAAPLTWRIEKDAASSAILRTSGSAAELEYRLAGGARVSQFVAMATDLDRQAFSAIHLAMRSERPMRVGVQVRSADGRRWGRSFYVDPAGTAVRARLTDLRPIGAGTGALPPAEALTSILLVIDLTNAAPGWSGRLTVTSSDLVK